MEQENFDMFNDDPNATTLSDKEIEEQINALLNVSDEEIQESLELAAKEEKRVGRKKTATSIKADKIVSDFLVDRSDQHWKVLQEFFWFNTTLTANLMPTIIGFMFSKRKKRPIKDIRKEYMFKIQTRIL